MATRFSSSLIAANDTDAHFRAWASFIEDTLVTTGGWLVSTETGDTAPGSLTHPTVANTKQGFRVYTMNDGALQTAAPVFMRIDFGSGGVANRAGIWVTIGQGSDGAGTITNVRWNGGASVGPNIGCTDFSTTQVNNSYGSANSARAALAMFIQNASANYPFIFTIERTKDASGADTADGLLLCYSDSLVGQKPTISRYIILASGTQPTAEDGLSYVITGQNPSETFSPGDIGIGILIHFKGVSQQPGTNIVFNNASDVGAEGNFQITLYGATRTYQNLNTQCVPAKAIAGSKTTDTNARANIRYD